METTSKFKIAIEERNFKNYALPPEDPLGELTNFELGWRRFCYDRDRRVLIEIGYLEFSVFFDPDICSLLEDDFPKKIQDLELGKTLRIIFAESYNLNVVLMPIGKKINCQLRKFGDFQYASDFELDKEQVLTVLKVFLEEVTQLAVNTGYLSLEDKEKFIAPAFPDKIGVAK